MDTQTLVNIFMVLGAGGLSSILTVISTHFLRKRELVKEENVGIATAEKEKENARTQAEQLIATARIQADQLVATAKLQAESQVQDSDLKIYEKLAARLDANETKLDALHEKENECIQQNMELKHKFFVMEQDHKDCVSERIILIKKVEQLTQLSQQNNERLINIEESVNVFKNGQS